MEYSFKGSEGWWRYPQRVAVWSSACFSFRADPQQSRSSLSIQVETENPENRMFPSDKSDLPTWKAILKSMIRRWKVTMRIFIFNSFSSSKLTAWFLSSSLNLKLSHVKNFQNFEFLMRNLKWNILKCIKPFPPNYLNTHFNTEQIQFSSPLWLAAAPPGNAQYNKKTSSFIAWISSNMLVSSVNLNKL